MSTIAILPGAGKEWLLLQDDQLIAKFSTRREALNARKNIFSGQKNQEPEPEDIITRPRTSESLRTQLWGKRKGED